MLAGGQKIALEASGTLGLFSHPNAFRHVFRHALRHAFRRVFRRAFEYVLSHVGRHVFEHVSLDMFATCVQALYRLYIGSISASPTARPLRGYGRAGTQNDRPLRGYGRAGTQNDRIGDGRAVGDADIEPIWSS